MVMLLFAVLLRVLRPSSQPRAPMRNRTGCWVGGQLLCTARELPLCFCSGRRILMLEPDDGSQLLVVVFEQSKRPHSLSSIQMVRNESFSTISD